MAKEMNYEALQANLRMIDKKGELAFEQARANGTLTPEQEKFSALMSNEDFLEKFLAADSVEEAQDILRENGLELSKEEINAFGKYIVGISKKLIENGGEISEEELAQVSGGALLAVPDSKNTAEMMGAAFGMMGGAAGGFYAGLSGGMALGTLICPVVGTAIVGVIGAIGGAVGGLIGGDWAGYGIVKGTKKLGGWIKSWF